MLFTRRTGNVEVFGFHGDMGVTSDIERIAEMVHENMDQIDVMVTCAGGPAPAALAKLTEEAFQDGIQSNALG